MKSALNSILIAAVASAAFAGAAYARNTEVFTVKLEAPAAQSRVIASNAIWNCDGDTCVARPSHTASVRECRQFVRESGARVTAYGPESDPLSADEIARCNGDTQTTTAANQ